MTPTVRTTGGANPAWLVFALLLTAGRLAAQPGELPPPPAALGVPVPHLCPAPAPLPPLPALPPLGPPIAEGAGLSGAVLEVVIGQGRVVTLREELKFSGDWAARVAVGDPDVVEAIVLNPRQIRVKGLRIGVSDLAVVTADGRAYTYEVRVVIDLAVLQEKLNCLFPGAHVKLTQVRDRVAVQGEARDAPQVARIIEAVQSYVADVHRQPVQPAPPPEDGKGGGKGKGGPPAGPGVSTAQLVNLLEVQEAVAQKRVINLLRVPGPQQVLLKVRVAELNRTAMREIGADWLAAGADGPIVGTQLSIADVTGQALTASQTGGLVGEAASALGESTTAFAIFREGDVAVMLDALRRNQVMKILAEPNLVALNGHRASFLAGGKFPVPVPQATGSFGGAVITVEFQPFGVNLTFTPYILDGGRIRLTVDPVVSSIDRTLGIGTVPGVGISVPGLNSREAHTTVELGEGQTLAIAGLLELRTEGDTKRIPGLGDLPVLGPFFSKTTSRRTEKELVVLVTPYLIEPNNPGQVPPTPGDTVGEPNDLEFYLLNRIESRTGRDFRSTVEYDDALGVLRCLMRLHGAHVHGPHGFCD